ncbi:MAG TPA: hypothetical protein PKM84_00280 [Candidatus Pacearchaeota archaeon]|nr:hypothetical protein [Candidatus Pacearchaeota archaeon]
MKNNEKIIKLAKLFAEYKIYPERCFGINSPAKVFQSLYPHNHYSEELKEFLSYQNYLPIKRGADLPWWGKDYFGDEKKFRVMVISQDSLSKDAGSIVFFMHLMSVIFNEIDYKRYVQNTVNHFSFKSWERIKKLFTQWNIDFAFLYVTDGKKVYKFNSRRDGDFDKEKSKELLEREIDLCSPDLIIILGKDSLSLLNESITYSQAFKDKKGINIRGKQCIVAPFPIGQGSIRPEFENRLNIATSLITNIIH